MDPARTLRGGLSYRSGTHAVGKLRGGTRPGGTPAGGRQQVLRGWFLKTWRWCIPGGTGTHSIPGVSFCTCQPDSISPVKFKELPPTPKYQQTSPTVGTRLQHRSLSGSSSADTGPGKVPGQGALRAGKVSPAWWHRVCGVVPGGAQPADVLACLPTSCPRGPTPWSQARSGKDGRCLLAPAASPPSEPGKAPSCVPCPFVTSVTGMPAPPRTQQASGFPPATETQ